MLIRRCFRYVAAASICFMAAGWPICASSQQQTFPSRPITLIAPFSAGSSADILARRLSDGLKRELGASAVIVENVPGAGGILGAVKVKNSEPDGYTLLIGAQGIQVINPLIRKGLAYTPDDFVPIANLVSFPNILLVHPSLGVSSVAELISLAKARAASGKPLNYGHGGSGTSSHLAAELFSQATGVELTAVPYKSVADTASDLLSGRLDVVFGIVGIFEQHVRNKSVAALAITAPKRTTLFPDIPTVAEAGYPQAEMNVWMGLFGRAGTSPATLAMIEKAAIAAITTPTVKSEYEREGAEVAGKGSEEFRLFIEDDTKKWTTVIPKLTIGSN